MKIKVLEKTTEIECNAEELRNSNSLADTVSGLLRNIFRPAQSNYTSSDSNEDGEEQEGEE